MLLQLIMLSRLLLRATAHFFTSDLNTLDSFKFLTRFAFFPVPRDKVGWGAHDIITPIWDANKVQQNVLPRYGLLRWNYYFDRVYTMTPYLLIYTDYDTWLYVKRNRVDCATKIASADISFPLFQYFSGEDRVNQFTEGYQYQFPTGYSFGINGNAKGTYVSLESQQDYMYRKNQSLDGTPSPPVFAFLAIANCKLDFKYNAAKEVMCSSGGSCAYVNVNENNCSSCQGPLSKLSIAMELTNGGYLSADEIGMPACCITFLVLQIILLAFAGLVTQILRQKKKFHFTVKLVVISIVFQFLGMILSTVYWVRLNIYGVKAINTYFGSTFMLVLANYFIILNFILVAKGWTIVRKSISTMGKVKLVAASSFYIIAVICACTLETYSFDQSILTFRYAEPAGILCAFLRIIAWVWFIRALQITFANYSKKKRFYRKFALFGSIWLMALPIMALTTIGIDPMFRQVYLNVWEYTLVFLGQFVLLLLYNPILKYNSSFPFHQKVEETPDGYPAPYITKDINSINSVAVASSTNVQAEVFDDIRGIGGNLAKKISAINRQNLKLLSILRDWDGEVDDDIDNI